MLVDIWSNHVSAKEVLRLVMWMIVRQWRSNHWVFPSLLFLWEVSVFEEGLSYHSILFFFPPFSTEMRISSFPFMLSWKWLFFFCFFFFFFPPRNPMVKSALPCLQLMAKAVLWSWQKLRHSPPLLLVLPLVSHLARWTPPASPGEKKPIGSPVRMIWLVPAYEMREMPQSERKELFVLGARLYPSIWSCLSQPFCSRRGSSQGRNKWNCQCYFWRQSGEWC